MDKVDRPYYIFRIMKLARRFLPPWLPLIGIEGGQFNIVLVDFVARPLTIFRGKSRASTSSEFPPRLIGLYLC